MDTCTSKCELKVIYINILYFVLSNAKSYFISFDILPFSILQKFFKYITSFVLLVASGGLIKVLKDKASDGKETGVAILKLNNPSAMNALTVPMGDEFKETIHKLTKDSSIR